MRVFIAYISTNLCAWYLIDKELLLLIVVMELHYHQNTLEDMLVID